MNIQRTLTTNKTEMATTLKRKYSLLMNCEITGKDLFSDYSYTVCDSKLYLTYGQIITLCLLLHYYLDVTIKTLPQYLIPCNVLFFCPK